MFDVISRHESLLRNYNTIQQMTNFKTTPSWEMNENFKLPTKHDILQFIIQVFVRHPFPSLTQQNSNHAHKT